ncbi:hypothetical protein DsansV1_C01g0012221 [Dioscorea sansibarensis]
MKFSSPATVECSLPAAHPLLTTRTALFAGSPITRVPSTAPSNSSRPFAFFSFLLFLSSSLSFLSQLSTLTIRDKLLISFTFPRGNANCNFPCAT